jgi:hypothetical protein
MIVSYSTVLMLEVAGNIQQPPIVVKIESNFTSTTCIDDKRCVTKVCINNELCHIITSNSTNTANNSMRKKNISPPFPQANI